jgi:sec-independent protein translocase protein TatC
VRKFRPIGHEDRLSIVEHLDELRTRIIVSLLAFAAAFGLCAWQNHTLLEILNEPLPAGREPVTLGVAEPFTTTLTLAAYGGIVIALPVILYQLYAFVLPAFSPTEKRVAMPLLLLVPFLFAGGVIFGYYIVLPKAIQFLLDFNADEFNVQIRAREYYSFVSLALVSIGVLFQIPVGVLALTRMGITTPASLRRNRRYALLVIAILAAALPGVDPITMLIEMVPLAALYELSILLAVLFGGRSREVPDRLASAEGS